jgi:DNA (cytosine-5)-methyltransferase 1
MRHGSLFSGIGGFDLAAEWMGWENVFHCEWMEFPRKVLDYYFPNADSHIDICKTDFKKYANTIDILTGGFPCQPFSMAGKRKGKDDERYLWGEMLRAIQEIKPKFVIAENVFGITNIDGGLVFEQVCLDLEAEGYEVQPFIICAAAKNAPHRRDRCWFIAFKNTLHSGCLHGRNEQEGAEIWEQRNTCTRGADGIHLSKGNATNTNGNGFNECNGNDEINTGKGGEYALGDIEQGNVNGDVANSDSTNNQAQPQKGILGQKNKRRKTRRFVDGNTRTQWNEFPTQSPICGGDDGLPTELDGITFSKWRAESIKGYGNAIVPQVALELFKIIETI